MILCTCFRGLITKNTKYGVKRWFSASSSQSHRAFAVVFDIDGVLLRGEKVLDGAKEAVNALIQNQIPFAFMTNGGGDFEAKRLSVLQRKLQIPVGVVHESTHMILAHTPMQELVDIHKNDRVMVLGCRNELEVGLETYLSDNLNFLKARHYGFEKTVSPQHFAQQHEHMYPFQTLDSKSKQFENDPFRDEPVKAIMIMHDPVDWHLEIQVCCDILLHRVPEFHGREPSRIPLYNSNEDFFFAGAYQYPRFAQGAFLTCLSHIYYLNCGHHLGETAIRESDLIGYIDVQRYGKPNKVTFDFAEKLLKEQLCNNSMPFEKIFMIGDNPAADIKGANAAGSPWYSILVETGVYRDRDQHQNARSVFQSNQ